MTERWAALVHLPPEKTQQLSALLEERGVRPYVRRWENSGDDWPSTLPVLTVTAAETFAVHRERLPWLDDVAPQRVILVSTDLSPSDSLRLCRGQNLLNVVPAALWGNPLCLARLFGGFLEPSAMFDLRLWFESDVLTLQCGVKTLGDKHQVTEKVVALARPYGAAPRRIRDLRLMVNELLNNALFHSFRDSEGNEKYSPRKFSGLAGDDSVMVEAAVSGESIVLAVEDNAGTLQPDEVIRYLLRQTSGEGVYDNHGRGLFLVANLSDHLNLCLAGGRRTRVVALSHGHSPSQRTLAFFIND